jgi:hypothetical protein
MCTPAVEEKKHSKPVENVEYFSLQQNSGKSMCGCVEKKDTEAAPIKGKMLVHSKISLKRPLCSATIGAFDCGR